MKAIEYLKCIKIMDAKIYATQEEIAQLLALATKTTSVMGDERVQSSGSQQKMENAVVKMAMLKNNLNEQIDSFYDYKEEVKNVLFEACDGDCIALLYKRYFLDKKWEEIAVEMNYTYKWVSGGLHQRALSQVQKLLDERGKEDGCK